MKSYLVFVFFSIFTLSSFAQDVVLDKDVDKQYEDKKGPNMRYYGHFYQALGFAIPYEEMSGANIQVGKSSEYFVGYRYKLKLLSFYAIGFDVNYIWRRYGIKSEPDLPVDVALNPFSQASLVDKMNLGLSSLGGEVYNRVNIGKRGNVLGKYFDIGIKAEWNIGNRLVIKQKAVAGDYFEKSRSVQKNLNFIEKFSTLLTARIGINNYSIYGNYRISNLFTTDYSIPELPPLTAGFQMKF